MTRDQIAPGDILTCGYDAGAGRCLGPTPCYAKPNRGRTPQARMHWSSLRDLMSSAREWHRDAIESARFGGNGGAFAMNRDRCVRSSRERCRLARAADREG